MAEICKIKENSAVYSTEIYISVCSLLVAFLYVHCWSYFCMCTVSHISHHESSAHSLESFKTNMHCSSPPVCVTYSALLVLLGFLIFTGTVIMINKSEEIWKGLVVAPFLIRSQHLPVRTVECNCTLWLQYPVWCKNLAVLIKQLHCSYGIKI